MIGAVGQSGNNFNIDSLVFAGGVMYSFTDHTSVTAPDHIITINLATGAGIDTGLSYANNGFPATDSIFAAAVAIPEPSTVAMACAGMVVGGYVHWRSTRSRKRRRAKAVLRV